MTDYTLDFVGPGARLALDWARRSEAAAEAASGHEAEAEIHAATALAALADDSLLEHSYATKAAATAALAGIPADAFVQVIADESRDGQRAIYRKVSGALVFQVDAGVSSAIVSSGSARRFLQVKLDANVSGEEFNYTIFQTDFSSGGRAPDDTVVQWGWNAAQSDRADATKPACYWQMERRYSNTAGDPDVVPQAFEVMVQNIGSDGQSFRPFFMYIPRDGTVPGMSYQLYNTDVINWSEHSPVSAPVQRIDWRLRDKYARFYGGFRLLGDNNAPMMQFLNAAGTGTINGPFVNASDILQSSAATYVVGAPKNAIGAGPAVATVQGTGMAVDETVLHLVGSAVAGNLFALRATAAVTGLLKKQLFNSGGAVSQELVVNALGDIMIVMRATGGTNAGAVTFGWHRASGEFRVCWSESDLTSGVALQLSAAGKAVLGGPVVGAIEVLAARTGTAETLAITDYGRYVTCTNAAAIALTVPPNVFPVGTQIVVEQGGAGAVTFTPGAGVTVNSRGGLVATAGQYAVATLIQKSANVWTLTGDLA